MTDILITRAKNGDGEAFAELFSAVSDELYRVAFLYVKNREDAKDVVQETAFKCFKNIKHLRQGEYFRTWAVKTAMNCALDMLRKNRRTVSLEDFAVPPKTLESPENEVLASVTLDGLMNVLNEREKSVLLLRHMYDLSLPDIAKMLRLPLGTVKTILYRAIAKIKKENSYET